MPNLQVINNSIRLQGQKKRGPAAEVAKFGNKAAAAEEEEQH